MNKTIHRSSIQVFSRGVFERLVELFFNELNLVAGGGRGLLSGGFPSALPIALSFGGSFGTARDQIT